MCGIAGFIGSKKIDKNNIDKTILLMRNRGPDSSAYKKKIFENREVLLIHSRLSIIDLDSRSNQPFEDNDYTIIFNGEIYNYIELKKQIIAHGYKFQTDSDTEVILKYYQHYGESCVKYFEGMWSFAIWDNKLKKLFLSRDRFGEKPLYFYKSNDGFFFASETKFIKSLSNENFDINYEKLNSYFIRGYRAIYKNNSSYFSKIFSIENATNVSISLSSEIKKYQYWNLEPNIEKNLSIQDAIEESRKKLIQSMKIRLRSDVPIAFCLSGGIDSASLASIATKELNKKTMTFSIIDSDKRYNEKGNIDIINQDLDCENQQIFLKNKNNLDNLKKLVEYHDSPISTISYFIHSFLSNLISNNGYKVSISGSAADEIYTGYYDHYLLHLNDCINDDNYSEHLKNWQKHVEPIIRNPRLKNIQLYKNNPENLDNINFDHGTLVYDQLFTKQNITSKSKKFSKNFMKNRLLNELFYETVPLFLDQDDLNSMYNSVENRSPYLDTDLVSFLFNVPNNYLIKNGYNKYILRMSMEGILNDKIRLDREKKGFNASMHSLFNFKDRELIDYILRDNYIFNLIPKPFFENILKKDIFSDNENKLVFYALNIKIFMENKI